MINKKILSLPNVRVLSSIVAGVVQACSMLAELSAIVILLSAIAFHAHWNIPAYLVQFTDNTTALLCSIGVCIAIRIVCTLVSQCMLERMQLQIHEGLTQALLQAVFANNATSLRDGLQYISKNQRISMMSTEGIKAIATYFTAYLPTFIQSLAMMIVSLVVIAPYNWLSAMIIVAGMIALPIVANASRDHNIAVQMQHLKQYENVGQRFEEALRGLPTLKIFSADRSIAQELSKGSEGFRRITMGVLHGQLRSLIASDGVIYASVILATVSAIAMNPHDYIAVVIILALAVRLFESERQLVYLSHAAAVGIRQAHALHEIFDEHMSSSGVTTASSNYHKHNFAVANDNSTIIALNAMSFSYLQNGDSEVQAQHGNQEKCNNDVDAVVDNTVTKSQYALNNISLVFPATGHYAIVGTSGSGKSTLVDILAGNLRERYEGSITLGDMEISELSSHDISSVVTLVKGNDHLISGTIRSNLDITNRGYDDVYLEKSLRAVGLWSLIAERGGLDSPVAAGGSNFSGGQRQRLCIARAILRETPIYIFDEATSAVDRQYDAIIADLVAQLSKRALVVTVTHRLATIRNADYCYVLDKGSLVQQGSVDELLQDSAGLFAQEWIVQHEIEQCEDDNSHDYCQTEVENADSSEVRTQNYSNIQEESDE